MIQARAEATIERPAEDVWAYAADIARHVDWMTVSTAELLEGTGSQVGDRGRERIRLGPFVRDTEFTVIAADPGRRIVWRAGANSPFSGDLALELEPLGPTSTRATYGGTFTGRGLLRWLEPLLAGEIRQGPAKELLRLKEQVEGRP